MSINPRFLKNLINQRLIPIEFTDLCRFKRRRRKKTLALESCERRHRETNTSEKRRRSGHRPARYLPSPEPTLVQLQSSSSRRKKTLNSQINHKSRLRRERIEEVERKKSNLLFLYIPLIFSVFLFQYLNFFLFLITH